VVLGHHPHTLQPMQWLPRKGGGKHWLSIHWATCIQHDAPQNMLGGILDIDVTKDW
jgi:hypothetical protein